MLLHIKAVIAIWAGALLGFLLQEVPFWILAPLAMLLGVAINGTADLVDRTLRRERAP